MHGLSLSIRLYKAKSRRSGQGFKREYSEDTSAFGAKIVQFWKLQLQVGRISRAQIIAATKVCDLLTSRKKTQNLVLANKSTLKLL